MRWATKAGLLLTFCLNTAMSDPLPVCPGPGSANWFFTNQTTIGGATGLHINRPLGDPYPNTVSFDYGGETAWGMGLDSLTEGDYTGTPDLILAFSKDLMADNLRMRADDARTNLGPMVGHPVMPFQLSVMAGTSNAHLGGIGIGTYGYQYSLYLFNRGNSKRTHLNFQNLFGIYTDSQQNGVGDLTLKNFQSNSAILRASPTGGLAFYGANPVARPVVSGSWSNGTAQKSLLAALVSLGLATDQTTE